MPGIINTSINQDDPLKSIVGYDPDKVQLGAEDMVENRVAGIISKNSPLMQQAHTGALQQMNQRGLVNSSMAVGAGQDAVIRNATPIASQDANTSTTAKLANQNAGNTAKQFTAGSQNQGALAQHQGLLQKEMQATQGSQALEQIAAQGAQSINQIGAQGEVNKMLQLIQGGQTLEQIAAQGNLQQQLQNIVGAQRLSEIYASGDIQQLVQELQGKQALEQIGAQGGISKELQEMSQQHQTAMQNLIHLQNLGTIDAQTMSQLRVNQQQIDAQFQRDIQLHQQALEAARQSGDLQAQRDAQLQIYNLENMRAQQHNQIELANINFTHQEALASLGHEHQTQLQEMMNKHQTTLQNSAAAVSLYGTAMQAIAQIGSMEGLTQAQRDAGVNQQYAFLEAGMQLAGADIGDIPLFNSNKTTATGTGTVAETTRTGTVAQGTTDVGATPTSSLTPPTGPLRGFGALARWDNFVADLGTGRYPGEIREFRFSSRNDRPPDARVAWDGSKWVNA